MDSSLDGICLARQRSRFEQTALRDAAAECQGQRRLRLQLFHDLPNFLSVRYGAPDNLHPDRACDLDQIQPIYKTLHLCGRGCRCYGHLDRYCWVRELSS